MKTVIAFTTLTLLVAPAWASHQNNNPDLSQSITNVHASHFPHVEGDSHGPEKGEGSLYGAIVLDLQAGERHVPHGPGDSHEPEKGEGDTYGSAINAMR